MKSAPWGLALALLVSGACDGQLEFDVPTDAGTATAGQGAVAGSTAGSGTTGCDDCTRIGLVCADEWQVCVECVDDTTCPGSVPHCDQALHRCAPCDAAMGCERGNVCDGWTHRCVRSCATEMDPDHDCHGTDLECDLERAICRACSENDDCLGSPDGPYCLPGGAGCAQCATDADCAGRGTYCDPIAFVCVNCKDSRDCAAGTACDPASHRCLAPETAH